MLVTREGPAARGQAKMNLSLLGGHDGATVEGAPRSLHSPYRGF